ncbi:MAG: hypothetical protein WDZ72_10445 [Cyclobacteriaceae bacterium]
MNKKDLELLIGEKYEFDIKAVLIKGWETFRVIPFYSMAYTLLILSIQLMFMVYVPDFIFIFSLFLAGPLFAGFYLVANKISQKEEVIYPDFFGGFGYYIPIVLVWLVGQVLTLLGLFALIIPGIYLMIGYMFAVLISVFFGLDFWNSLEYSRKLIHGNWVKFFIFGLVLAVLNIAGALVFVFGLVVTIPVTYYAIYHLFENLTKNIISED